MSSEAPTARQLASALAVVRVVEDAIGDERVRIRQQAKTVLREHMDEHGSDSVIAQLPDGTRITKLSLRSGTESARVVDEAAFLAWTVENHPTEVAPAVRESFRRSVLAQVKKTGDLPPGVSMCYGEETIALSPISQEARAAVLEALRGGRIALPGGGSE